MLRIAIAKLSRSFTTDSVFGFLRRVDLSSVVNISEVHDASIYRVDGGSTNPRIIGKFSIYTRCKNPINVLRKFVFIFHGLGLLASFDSELILKRGVLNIRQGS
jgi:hypothetical protein